MKGIKSNPPPIRIKSSSLTSSSSDMNTITPMAPSVSNQTIKPMIPALKFDIGQIMIYYILKLNFKCLVDSSWNEGL